MSEPMFTAETIASLQHLGGAKKPPTKSELQSTLDFSGPLRPGEILLDDELAFNASPANTPFMLGAMLLERMPKDRAEIQAIRQGLDLREAAEAAQRATLPAQDTTESEQRTWEQLSDRCRVSNTALPDSSSSLFSRLKSDEQLFESLPSGGGGIDWLNVSVSNGKLTERGKAVRKQLLEARDKANQAHENKAVVYLTGVDEPFLVHHSSVGQGATRQPLLVQHCGFSIRYGKVDESYPATGGNKGTAAIIEAPGLIMLKYGEAGVLRRMQLICDYLGIEVLGCRATRCDVCADLIDCDIEKICRLIPVRHFTTHATDVDVHYRRQRATGVTAKTANITLNIYEKRIEIDQACDEEKRDLMIKNRWGCLPDTAVRCEFQFSGAKLSNLHFRTLGELFAGLGVLIEWATNDWFRLVECNSRSNVSRSAIYPVWIRIIHAFAFWAKRHDQRPEPKHVVPTTAVMTSRQARGLINGTLVRLGYRRGQAHPETGIIIDSDETAFEVLRLYLKPGELMEGLQRLGEEWDCKRGFCHLPGQEAEVNDDDLADGVLWCSDCGRLVRPDEQALVQSGECVCRDCLS